MIQIGDSGSLDEGSSNEGAANLDASKCGRSKEIKIQKWRAKVKGIGITPGHCDEQLNKWQQCLLGEDCRKSLGE